jgi:hypothetical protein
VSGAGNQFTVLVPAYSLVDLIVPPVATNPPVLAVISNHTVNAGQTVAFVASATDTNQPPPTLTFRLLAGATNAVLDTNSGTFSWRPLVTQAGTSNSFTLQVAESSAPGLSAAQTFYVLVNPLIPPALSSVTLNHGLVAFQAAGQSGPDYAVEVSTNLTAWDTVFITNSPRMPLAWGDTNAANLPARFYRLKAGPPLP